MLKFTAATLVLLALGTNSSLAAPVFTQVWDDSTGQANPWFTSQNDNGTQIAKVFDNFTLGNAASITDVHWTGFLGNVSVPITSFLIQFWADNGGQPAASGNAILSETVSGNANQTFIKTVEGFNYYRYDVDQLQTAFAAQEGTQYWISIQANLSFTSGTGTNWGWATATGTGTSYQAGQNGALTPQGRNLAFQLTSTPQSVPEPGSLVLAGLALAGMYTVRRKKDA